MIYKRNFFPSTTIHPGVSLKDILDAEGMTQKDLSLRTEITEKHLSNIIQGNKANITPETSLKLEKVFGISADYWNNLQKAYDEDLVRLKEKELIKNRLIEEDEIISQIEVYNDLVKLGFVNKTNKKEEKLNNLYMFFGVSSLKHILDILKVTNIVYKKSESLKINKYNLACWLRAGEIKINDTRISEYSKKDLTSTLQELKHMTKEEEVDISKIKKLLADSGIYFSYVPGFKNVPVFGITRKYKGIPFIQISDRLKKKDTFWFALFHELAHVQLHLKKKDDMLININNIQENKEKEANEWAGNYLREVSNLGESLKIIND